MKCREDEMLKSQMKILVTEITGRLWNSQKALSLLSNHSEIYLRVT